MIADRTTYLTPEGMTRITAELDKLKKHRKVIAERIKDAKEMGDLSENAEYAEAKNDQAFTEGKIMELEALLREATVVEKDDTNTSTVGVGSIVECTSEGETVTYHIVGTNEADPAEGKISHESPLGQAFMGKNVNDQVEITVPKGTMTFTIMKIS